MRGDLTAVQRFQAAKQDQGFEAGITFNFVDGYLNCKREVVDVTVSCKLATLLQ
jgi:hypothetical protein